MRNSFGRMTIFHPYLMYASAQSSQPNPDSAVRMRGAGTLTRIDRQIAFVETRRHLIE